MIPKWAQIELATSTTAASVRGNFNSISRGLRPGPMNAMTSGSQWNCCASCRTRYQQTQQYGTLPWAIRI